MELRGARVAVTGGTGYLGGAVVRDLVGRGARVTVLARRPAAAPELAGRREVALVQGDVAGPATLDLAGHDAVVHAAAWVAFGIPRGKRERFWRTNVEGTRNVVEACRKAGVRKLVHVSSIAALGDTRGEVATEDFPRGATHRSFYEATKRAAHDLALAAHGPGELDVAAVLPAVIVGKARPWPDGRRSRVEGPFDGLVRRFVAGRLPAMVTGDRATSFVHVDDTSDGVVRALERGTGPYLLTEWDGTMRAFFARLGAAVGRPTPRLPVPLPLLRAGLWTVEKAYHARGRVPPVSVELAASLAADMRFDASRARRELGWDPDLWAKLARDYGPRGAA